MTHAAPPELRLWRAFPWDADASAGQPFSAEYIPPTQWSGRFDLGGRPRVLYLAESPAQAVGEKLQRFRGQELDWPELNEFGRRLALVEVAVMFDPAHTLANLSDPAELVRYNCRPDELMSRDVTRTQRLSRELYQHGLAGFRVWSALTGDWHSIVLFVDRADAAGSLTYGEPELLELNSAALKEAARVLAISIAGS